ncbi:MAG: SH3 domain-containing protein, partial [Candidatus Dadabacteria bacterium]
RLAFTLYRLSKSQEEIKLLTQKIRVLDKKVATLNRKNSDIRERLFAIERALFKKEDLKSIDKTEQENDKPLDKQELKQSSFKKPLARALSKALLRTAPFEDADPLSVVNKGEIVLLEKVKDGWSKVKTDIGLKGWVKTSKIAYLNTRQ